MPLHALSRILCTLMSKYRVTEGKKTESQKEGCNCLAVGSLGPNPYTQWTALDEIFKTSVVPFLSVLRR